ARRGRAAYLGDRVVGTPDPGAVAMAMLLRAAVVTGDEADDPSASAVEELLAAGR
ncbi:DAK2 domain-containing protein, partial [Pseudokineococcus marinus]|nr:DAK2 domain-containing protein [Pseudokineococcus marinus]